MFSIIISEKGGAERKESFDKNEINVGRVQGNDLMLPKGNVSKHHARLLYRDGRFIVTDLKSTNGTYVNGRKIAQATIVREGDKIYIGDFVLRLDSPAAAQPDGAPPPGEEESIRTLARNQQQGQPQPAVTLKAQTHPPPNATGGAMARPQPGPAGPQGPGLRAEQSAVSHYPLERDPDESEPPGQKGPPRAATAPPPQVAQAAASPIRGGSTMQLPQGASVPQRPPVAVSAGGGGMAVPIAQGPMGQPLASPLPPSVAPAGGIPPLVTGPMAQVPMAQGPVPAPLAPPPMAQPPLAQAPIPQPHAPAPNAQPGPAAAPARQVAAAPAPAPRQPVRETAAQAGRRLALITLVDRMADAVDLRPLKASPAVEDALSQRIERAAREQASLMRDEGEVPEGVDVEVLVRDAVRELVGLGPVGPLLEDDEVSEVHVVRHDQVLATRGVQISPADAAFTSEEALFRVIARLANQSGEPWRAGELIVERRLPRGAQMIGLAPPASSAHVLVVRKKRKVDVSLEELVRAGALSRPMAVFLETCVSARANVLVCGPTAAATSQTLAGLASTGPAGERIVCLHEFDEINASHAHLVLLPLLDTRARGEEAVRAAAKLHPYRLIVSQLAGSVAAATLDAVAEGAEGVVASMHAPSLRQGLGRLVAQLVAARGGGVDAARELVGESFDIAIEIATTPDGRTRIARIAELMGADGKGVASRDLFVLEAGGDHAATGTVPRIVGDLTTRGVKLDASIFKRGR